ncbi:MULTISPECIES: hypothetical protein [Nostocaceae]|nr:MULTISPECIES: hypothetical protein [Nostocaceae]
MNQQQSDRSLLKKAIAYLLVEIKAIVAVELTKKRSHYKIRDRTF